MNQASIKQLPKEITSYDLLKSLAVITMIIDHIGYYFFPEQIEWRIIGRMSMPIWLFLIGYARTREITPTLWIGGGLLIIGDIVTGMPLLSLNILFTIIFVRFFLNGVMEFAEMGRQTMFMIIMTFSIAVLPTVFIFDYGMQAMLFAMFGYMVRNQLKMEYKNEAILLFAGVIFIVYVSYQKLLFGMNNYEFFTTTSGVLMVCIILTQFTSQTLPSLTAKLPNFAGSALKFMGRNTLEIYVVHLLLFKAIGLFLYPYRYQLFQWTLF